MNINIWVCLPKGEWAIKRPSRRWKRSVIYEIIGEMLTEGQPRPITRSTINIFFLTIFSHIRLPYHHNNITRLDQSMKITWATLMMSLKRWSCLTQNHLMTAWSLLPTLGLPYHSCKQVYKDLASSSSWDDLKWSITTVEKMSRWSHSLYSAHIDRPNDCIRLHFFKCYTHHLILIVFFSLYDKVSSPVRKYLQSWTKKKKTQITIARKMSSSSRWSKSQQKGPKIRNNVTFIANVYKLYEGDNRQG